MKHKVVIKEHTCSECEGRGYIECFYLNTETDEMEVDLPERCKHCDGVGYIEEEYDPGDEVFNNKD